MDANGPHKACCGGRGMHVCALPLSPRSKYGFSVDRNAVLEGEDKSKLTNVTPSCVPKNAKMYV